MVTGVGDVFLLVAETLTVCMAASYVSSHRLVGHSSGFHFGAVMNIDRRVCVGVCAVLSGVCLGLGLLGHLVTFSSLEELPDSSPGLPHTRVPVSPRPHQRVVE